MEYIWSDQHEDDNDDDDDDDDDDEEKPANERCKKQFTKAKSGWDYKISGLPSVRLHFGPEHVNDEWRRAKHLLITETLIKECVAVDCETMANQRVKNSLQMRMKFYLNVDVSKQEPDQMRTFIRDIHNSMQFVTDETIGLYQFRKKKPFLASKP